MRIQLVGDYFIARVSYQEGMYLRDHGWWYYGWQSNGHHAACLRRLGVEAPANFLPVAKAGVAAQIYGAPNVEFSPDAEARVSGLVEALKASRDSGEASDDLPDVPAPEGLSYRPYQLAGIKVALKAFAENRKGVLIADEMGLGKTMQGIGCMAVLQPQRAIVMCPTSLRANWCAEIRKWLPGTTARVVESASQIPTVGVAVVGYASLPGKSERAAELRSALEDFEADLFVADEAHMLKNPKSQTADRTRSIVARARRVLYLSGTPIANCPKESIELLKAIGVINTPKEEKNFLFRYCDPQQVQGGSRLFWQFRGASNPDELQTMLRTSGVFVRRLKRQVLKELPPKQRGIVVLGSASDQIADLERRIKVEDISELVSRASSFQELSAYRAALAKEKAPLVKAYLTDLLSDPERTVLVFAHHRAMLDMLGGIEDAIRIDGDTPTADRQNLVDQFQLPSGPRLALLSTRAAGVGLTLTKANTVVIAEADWNPSWCVQAEDRAHRLGQEDTVDVQYLVLDGTIDARVLTFMLQKLAMSDRVLNDVDETPPDEAPTPAPAPVEVPRDELQEMTIRTELGGKRVQISIEQAEAVRQALLLLSGQCDGARSKDDCGFDGADAGSTFLQSLVEAAKRGRLSLRQAAYAREKIRKYSKQLTRGGIGDMG